MELLLQEVYSAHKSITSALENEIEELKKHISDLERRLAENERLSTSKQENQDHLLSNGIKDCYIDDPSLMKEIYQPRKRRLLSNRENENIEEFELNDTDWLQRQIEKSKTVADYNSSEKDRSRYVSQSNLEQKEAEIFENENDKRIWDSDEDTVSVPYEDKSPLEAVSDNNQIPPNTPKMSPTSSKTALMTPSPLFSDDLHEAITETKRLEPPVLRNSPKKEPPTVMTKAVSTSNWIRASNPGESGRKKTINRTLKLKQTSINNSFLFSVESEKVIPNNKLKQTKLTEELFRIPTDIKQKLNKKSTAAQGNDSKVGVPEDKAVIGNEVPGTSSQMKFAEDDEWDDDDEWKNEDMHGAKLSQDSPSLLGGIRQIILPTVAWADANCNGSVDPSIHLSPCKTNTNQNSAKENNPATYTNAPATTFKFRSEVVRNQEERAKLKGINCRDCREYYSTLNLPPDELEERLNKCSRHRDHFAPPPTPEHFWSIDFPTTQQCKEQGILNTTQHRPLQSHRKRPQK